MSNREAELELLDMADEQGVFSISVSHEWMTKELEAAFERGKRLGWYALLDVSASNAVRPQRQFVLTEKGKGHLTRLRLEKRTRPRA